MASWNLINGRNANYIVVYSILHSINQKDIANWVQQSDAVILEQGTNTSEPIQNTIHFVGGKFKSTRLLFEELEREKAIPVFTTDVSPEMKQKQLEDLFRIFVSTGLAADIGININELMKKNTSRREFLTRGLRMGLESVILLKLWPAIQTLSIEAPGKRSNLQELMRKDIANSQEFSIPWHSADIRDAINSLKMENIATQLHNELGKRPTILVYDFRPNHAMLQDFLQRPENAVIYLKGRNIASKVVEDEIPRILRFDYNGKTWNLQKLELNLPKIRREITPKLREPKLSRKDFFRKTLLGRMKKPV